MPRLPTVPFLTFVLTLFLSGCSLLPGGVDVSTRFDRDTGLTKGQAVMMNNVEIGKVSGVEAADGQTLIQMKLDSQRADSVQKNAAALVQQGPPVRVEIFNPPVTSASVESGDELVGLNSTLELTVWAGAGAIGSLGGLLDSAMQDINRFLESDEWSNAKHSIDRELQNLGKQSGQAFTEFSAGIDKFISELEADSNQALQEALREYEALKNELEAFRQSGDEQAVDIISRLLEILRQALEGAQPGSTTSI